MRRGQSALWFIVFLFPCLLGGHALAESVEPANSPPTVRATQLSHEYPFDGSLQGSAWDTAPDSIANLVTVEPEEGGVPQGTTIVKVFANQNDIIVGVRCLDPDPKGIVSFSKARDAVLDAEDHIVLVLDTFQDGRSGYVFAVNPSGARFDGLVIEQGEDVNSDWDTVWEAKTSRSHLGWCAEIRIPIKSLGFKKDLSQWGFNVQRRVQRLQETSRWSGASLDYTIFQTSRAGVLGGLPRFDFGVGTSIRAAVVGQAGRPDPDGSSEYDGDLSLDLTQKLGPNLLSALTLNTDFAETEVDVRQINLSRFPTFFPEKRSFFQEGSDVFQFGVGLDEDNLLPFFSRRIGLPGFSEEDQEEIPINAGGKINGRVGETNLGALVVNTREVDSLDVGDATIHVPQTTMGALRVRRNVLEESSLGMMATFGDQLSRSNSWSAGVDFTYRTSSFGDEKNFLAGVWGLLNGREGLEGDKSAFGVRVDYPNDFLDANFSSIRIGDGFDPSLGFVFRNDVHIWDLSAEINPRPPVSFVRQAFHEVSVSLFNDLDNSRWQSYLVTIKPLSWLLESGEQFEFTIEPEGDRPDEPFDLTDDVEMVPGSYEFTRYILGASSAAKRRVSGEVLVATGNFYNGDLNTLEGRIAVKPSALLTVELSGERNSGTVLAPPDDVDGTDLLIARDFTEELVGIRFQLNISSDLQISSLTQYDTQSRELGSNNRLRWTFDPLGDLFVVYNHNLIRTIDDRWKFVSNQFPVKLQYALRF